MIERKRVTQVLLRHLFILDLEDEGHDRVRKTDSGIVIADESHRLMLVGDGEASRQYQKAGSTRHPRGLFARRAHRSAATKTV